MLSFALGLESSTFVSGAQAASRSLGNLLSTAGKLTGIGALIGGAFAGIKGSMNVVQGVAEVFEKGASLGHLSKQTSESVETLYKLQKGFSAVGLDAESLGSVLFTMKKALGGVDEMGQSTHSIFLRLGLNLRDLKTKDAAEQFSILAQRIAKLDDESATNVASKIFGRGNAREIIQLIRSTDDFAAAMDKASSQAKVFARNAEAFERIEKSLRSLASKAQGLFAGIAEGAAPAVQMVLDKLNQIDLSGIGRQLGTIVGGFTEAFREGKLAQVLADTITIGFEMAVAMVPAIFSKIGVFLLNVFKTPLLFLQAGNGLRHPELVLGAA